MSRRPKKPTYLRRSGGWSGFGRRRLGLPLLGSRTRRVPRELSDELLDGLLILVLDLLPTLQVTGILDDLHFMSLSKLIVAYIKVNKDNFRTGQIGNSTTSWSNNSITETVPFGPEKDLIIRKTIV